MQNLRYAARLLARAPGFTAVAVLVLALGIGANTAVFSIVNELITKPLPGRVEELVGVFNDDRTKPGSYRMFSYPAYLDLRDDRQLFEHLTAHMATMVGVGDGDTIRREFAMVVSSNYFTTLGVGLAAGRPFTPEEERPGAATPVAVASYDVWSRRGFEPRFVGSTVEINGLDFTVVGVAPQGFKGTMALAGPAWWFPLGAYEQIISDLFREGSGTLAARDHSALLLAGTLRRGLTDAEAQARLDQLARQLSDAYPESDRDRAFSLAPHSRIGLSTSPGTDDQIPVFAALLLAMSGLVLLVACLNLANLMLARGNARRKEIALRLALGGARSRIVRQLMIEALLLSALGAAAGVVLAWWATAALAASFTNMFPISIVVNAAPDFRVLGAAALCAALSTVFFALGPAWSLSRTDLVTDMKIDARAPARTRTARLVSGPALVVGQLAVSLALVATGGLFVRGVLRIAGIDAGFPFERQLVIGVDPGLAGLDETSGRRLYTEALERLRSLPGVADTSFASSVPFGEVTEGRSVRLPGTEDAAATPIFRVIGAGYFQTLRLRMLGGREFTAVDELPRRPGATAAGIINQPLAERLFGRAPALGQLVQVRMRANEPYRTLEIIGVAPGLRHDLSDPAAVPHIYVAFGEEYRSSMSFHVRVAEAADPAAVLATASRELRQLNRDVPILEARSMAAHRDASFLAWGMRAVACLFGGFGALALLLAAIGVYGLEAHDVSRRTREIGIRVALGARRTDIAGLILGDAGRSAVWGLAIGLLLALGIGRIVSGILFGVSPYDPLVLAAAAATLSAATVLACWLPARRASRVEPLEALRSE